MFNCNDWIQMQYQRTPTILERMVYSEQVWDTELVTNWVSVFIVEPLKVLNGLINSGIFIFGEHYLNLSNPNLQKSTWIKSSCSECEKGKWQIWGLKGLIKIKKKMFRSETGICTRTRAGWADCSVDIITEMTEEAKKEKETLTEQRQSKPQTGLCWCTPRMFGLVVNLLVFVHKENQTISIEFQWVACYRCYCLWLASD